MLLARPGRGGFARRAGMAVTKRILIGSSAMVADLTETIADFAETIADLTR